MLLNKFRNKLYWIIDTIKGGHVKRHLKEISLILNNPTTPEVEAIKNKNLTNILNHAVKTTPFYNKVKSTAVLADFPVIRKTMIQDNFEKFESVLYKNKKNYKVSTSGSTGVPFFLFQDKNKRNRNKADAIYFLKRCGYKIGNCLYELEVWRSHNKKGKIKSWIQNVKQFDVSRMSESRVKQFLNMIKSDTNNKNILGFASSFELISQFLEKENLNIKIKNLNPIIANSEYLNPYTKAIVKAHLDIEILSRYSSEEIGIIAQQAIESPDKFTINHASYYVELLNLDNDEAVKEGEFGRIVVTDLFNYAMPIIRYDTGDIARFIKSKQGNTKFDKVEGRKMDLIYDTQGNIISSFVVYTKFYNYYSLLNQYQFIQHSKNKYEVKLNLKSNTFEFENDLIQAVKNDFGKDAIVAISYVDEIPPLSSGKRKKVVSYYTPE